MHGQPDLLGDLADDARLERLARLDEAGQQREQPLGPHRLAGQHRAVVAVVHQADHRRVDAGKLLVAVDRVDPRPAALDRLGRRAVDRAEPGVVVPIQQRGGRRDQLGADVVEDRARRGAGRAPRSRRAGPRAPPARRGSPTRACRRRGGRGRPRSPAACRPAWRPGRAPPGRRRSAPGCAGPPAAAGRRPSRRSRRRRRCAARRRGRRRPGTAAGRCAARKSATVIARRPRCGCTAAGRRVSSASTSGSSTRSSFPSRTTPSTMSDRCRGEPPTSLGLTSRSAMREPGVGGQQVFHHLDDARGLRRDAEQPACGLRGHHGGVGAGLLQQVLVLGFADRGDDLGVGRQLAGGQRDQHRACRRGWWRR